MNHLHSRRSTALKRRLVVFVLSALWGGLPPMEAAGQSSARSMAMSEASTGLASDIDAARYNPANLGLDGYRQNGLELVGIGVDIANNAFTLDDYNKYTGSFLTEADKDYLLSHVPRAGLTVVADVEATALAAALGSFVFTTSAVGLADVNLSRDVLDLILNGNSLADTIGLTGSYVDAVAYVASGLSYGVPIYTVGTRQLAVGGTLKLIRGLGVEKLVELNGMVSTLESGLAGNGSLIARTATGGWGYACDVGAAFRINDSYTAGVRVKNLLSSVSWTKRAEEHGYLFSFDTMTVDNMDEDYVVSEDYRRSIPSFSTSLPSTVNIGLANTSGKLLWAIDVEQGFRRAAGSSSKPRLSAGLEWWPWNCLPLRTGFAAGGNRNTSLSFGTGAHLGPMYIDAAVVTGMMPSPYATKGLNVAFTTGLHF